MGKTIYLQASTIIQFVLEQKDFKVSNAIMNVFKKKNWNSLLNREKAR